MPHSATFHLPILPLLLFYHFLGSNNHWKPGMARFSSTLFPPALTSFSATPVTPVTHFYCSGHSQAYPVPPQNSTFAGHHSVDLHTLHPLWFHTEPQPFIHPFDFPRLQAPFDRGKPTITLLRILPLPPKNTPSEPRHRSYWTTTNLSTPVHSPVPLHFAPAHHRLTRPHVVFQHPGLHQASCQRQNKAPNLAPVSDCYSVWIDTSSNHTASPNPAPQKRLSASTKHFPSRLVNMGPKKQSHSRSPRRKESDRMSQLLRQRVNTQTGAAHSATILR